MKTSKKQNSKATSKLALIFGLTLLLLIPKFLILNLIEERQQLNESVIREVSDSWAGDQLVTGPSLVIPYHYLSKNKNGETVASTKTNVILHPEKLEVIGDIDIQTKSRSLYEVLLYSSKLSCKGNFAIPDKTILGLADAQLLYDEAYIVMGVNDLKGIQNDVSLQWNSQKLKVSSGMSGIYFKYDELVPTNHAGQEYSIDGKAIKSVKTGLQSKVHIAAEEGNYSFAYDIDMNGSQKLLFCPLGKNTTVNVTSIFPDPSFIGDFLPSHNMSSSGFDAKWNILEYNKSTPAFHKGENMIDIGTNVFGVRIVEPIDNYAKTYRAGKYMILFIGLTFLVVFLTEVIQQLNIHIFQYLLIGLSLAIFFTLLLSISEFLGFDYAYFLSAISNIVLVFFYSLSMFGHRRSAQLLLGLLVLLFSYIYLIIQLEKSALLAGTIGLFVIIAATMYTTRKVKWYEEGSAIDEALV